MKNLTGTREIAFYRYLLDTGMIWNLNDKAYEGRMIELLASGALITPADREALQEAASLARARSADNEIEADIARL
jgi:hypothetical protein